jgi:hypothetical protein
VGLSALQNGSELGAAHYNEQGAIARREKVLSDGAGWKEKIRQEASAGEHAA